MPVSFENIRPGPSFKIRSKMRGVYAADASTAGWGSSFPRCLRGSARSKSKPETASAASGQHMPAATPNLLLLSGLKVTCCHCYCQPDGCCHHLLLHQSCLRKNPNKSVCCCSVNCRLSLSSLLSLPLRSSGSASKEHGSVLFRRKHQKGERTRSTEQNFVRHCRVNCVAACVAEVNSHFESSSLTWAGKIAQSV